MPYERIWTPCNAGHGTNQAWPEGQGHPALEGARRLGRGGTGHVGSHRAIRRRQPNDLLGILHFPGPRSIREPPRLPREDGRLLGGVGGTVCHLAASYIL